MGLYRSRIQKSKNQMKALKLFFFARAVIKKNIKKEIIRRFKGSKKKLNIFERIKNK
jgi:hypothetical protein